MKGAPRCPFSHGNSLNLSSEKGKVEKSKEIAKCANGSDDMYNGLGHKDGSLSFFPFSAGARSCPAKCFSLQIIRKVRISSLYSQMIYNI